MTLRQRIGAIIVVGVVLLALVTIWGFSETSDPSFCSSCHLIEPFADTWESSHHAAEGVECVDCHFEPGVVGYVKGKVYSIIKLTQFAAGETERKPEAGRLVIGSACIQCHEYVRDPEDPQYPADIVVEGITFPHAFHLDTANLSCADCHSALVHGSELVGEEKPQAAADPAFCSSCHTGDIAPILFGPIEPAGREHPGAPKIDVNVWRNIHWQVAEKPAVIDGVEYDQIEPETCAACHQDPTQARACKGCHFARVPEFAASPEAEQASYLPAIMWGFLFVLFMISVFLRGREKERFFSSVAFRVIGVLVLVSDAFVVYLILRDVFSTETGQREIGPTTVWISYLLLSAALLGFLLYEAGLLPQPLRAVHLPPADEDEFLVPKPIRRMRTSASPEPSPPPPTTPPTAEPPAEEAPSPKEPE